MKATRKTGTWLWALLAAAILTALLTATAFAGGNDFRCWTVDARQWTNQGYRSEKDGVWYLFLPADELLPGHWTGSMAPLPARLPPATG